MKAIATSIVTLCLVLFSFSCQNRHKEPSVNTFVIKNVSYSIDRCALINESMGDMSKYEIDLCCCNIENPYTISDKSQIKNLIWLSLTSEKIDEFTFGEYKFSSEGPNTNGHMTFSGKVTTEKGKMQITDGIVKIERENQQLRISLNLKLDDKIELKGNYSGDYISEK